MADAAIRVLSPEIAQKIAAGEVVERPSSVVKELVENALDAGASEVTVEIEDGGRSLIRVTDNGGGIAASEVPLAFLRHATSKIRTEEDLYHLSWMGFRGEALYSIAAVSRLTLVTRRPQDESGVRFSLSGGVVEASGPAGCPQGTSVEVRDLFFNTPARLKFLRSAQAESGAIGGLLSRLMLAHPEVSLRFVNRGKTIYQTPGDGNLRNVIHVLYGGSVSAQLVDVDFTEGDVRVSGVVGRPAAARSNRTQQSVFVNRRYVVCPMVAKAVEQAFGTLLMTQKFPFLVLNLQLPPEKVDVNVHPNKTQVRFEDDKAVFAAVLHATSQAVRGMAHTAVPLSALPPEKAAPGRRPEAAPGGLDRGPGSASEAPGADGVATTHAPPAKPLPRLQPAPQAASRAPLPPLPPSALPLDVESGIPAAPAGQSSRETAPTVSSAAGATAPQGPAGPPAVTPDAATLGVAIPPIEDGLSLEAAVARYREQTLRRTAAPGDYRAALQGHVQPVRQYGPGEARLRRGPAAPEAGHGQVPAPEADREAYTSEITRQQGSTPEDAHGQAHLPEAVRQQVPEPEALSMPGLSAEPQLATAHILGVVFDTYILAEQGENLLIIDQHAAHERLLYDQYSAELAAGRPASQQLLLPEVLHVGYAEHQRALQYAEVFQRLGFEVEDYGGNSLGLRAVPQVLGQAYLKDFFLEVLDSLEDYDVKARSRVERKLMSMACKAAVKGGDPLSLEELHTLLAAISQEDTPLSCPHGRPILVSLSRRQLEKQFKRVL